MTLGAGPEMIYGNRVNSADSSSYIATRSDEPAAVAN